MYQIMKKMLDDGAVTFQDCVDMLLDDEYLAKAGLADSEHLEDMQAFFTDIIIRGASINRVCEDGAIENYCFYFNDEGNLVSDHDARCLNDDGERFLCDDWKGEPIEMKEFKYIFLCDGWRKGWNNIDCEI